jgi:hypothetical protein
MMKSPSVPSEKRTFPPPLSAVAKLRVAIPVLPSEQRRTLISPVWFEHVVFLCHAHTTAVRSVRPSIDLAMLTDERDRCAQPPRKKAQPMAGRNAETMTMCFMA